MSLENAILELAKSITLHAEVLREANQPINIIEQETKINDISFEASKSPKKSKKEEKKVEEVVKLPEVYVEEKQLDLPFETNDQIITSEMCKDLAKEKMAQGVNRAEIKKLITELKGESISDLTEKNLVEFYNKLKELK
jgi:hypothetical protein